MNGYERNADSLNKLIKSSRTFDDVESQILFDNIVGGQDEMFFDWYSEKYGELPWNNLKSIPKERIAEYVNENPDILEDMEYEISLSYDDYAAGNTLDKNVNDFLNSSRKTNPITSSLFNYDESLFDTLADKISDINNYRFYSDKEREKFEQTKNYLLKKLDELKYNFDNDDSYGKLYKDMSRFDSALSYAHTHGIYFLEDVCEEIVRENFNVGDIVKSDNMNQISPGVDTWEIVKMDDFIYIDGITELRGKQTIPIRVGVGYDEWKDSTAIVDYGENGPKNLMLTYGAFLREFGDMNIRSNSFVKSNIKSSLDHFEEYVSSDAFVDRGDDTYQLYIMDKLYEKGFDSEEIEFGWYNDPVKAAREEIEKNFSFEDFVKWAEKYVTNDKYRMMWYKDWLRANGYPVEEDSILKKYSFDPARNTFPGPERY